MEANFSRAELDYFAAQAAKILAEEQQKDKTNDNAREETSAHR